MEDRYGGWRSMRNGDFQEEDVWAVYSGSNYSTSRAIESKDSYASAPLRLLPTAARMIPRANNSIREQPKVVQQSAPVNVPDWSKIYGKDSRKTSKSFPWSDDDDGDDAAGDDDDDDDIVNGAVHDGGDSDEDDDYQMVPPHEWIARKLASSQISSFSVFEGVGRTLKGRDLSRVRNAVLSKTGFLE